MKAEQLNSVENPQVTPELWQSLPNAPGVYLMKASDGTVIYVGKAIRLRSRVRSYFGEAGKPKLAVGSLKNLRTR